jgi:hypothetical protein
VSLPFLSSVNAGPLLATDPLTPAMKVYASPEFFAGRVGIADEPEVRLEALSRQAQGKTFHAAGEPTCTRISIGALKRQDVKLHRSLHV